MRSDLVFGAMTYVSNRYLLSRLASRAARELHKAGVRIEDTTNEVLERFSRANPIRCEPALRERPAVQLHSIMTRRVNPHVSEVVTLHLAREKSNPLLEAARVLGA
jgi:hypothetical protein